MITNFYIKDSDGTFKQTSLRYCTECMQIHLEHRQTCWTCGPWICTDCGSSMPDRTYTVCAPCRVKKREAEEADRFQRAEKISHTWHGPVYCGDEYYSSIDQMMEQFECCGEGMPGYVWACDTVPIIAMSADLLKDDGVIQNPHDEFNPEEIVIPDSMLKAIDEFNEANKHLVCWEPNFRKAILIEKGEVVG